ncbi:MAG TPA: amidophosphoribosyltransferase [Patescibacteria group bacterium]|nr:amidophosphoribosyltransferase [Patescibacteria group bacterium]
MLRIESDKWREECGVFGIYAQKDKADVKNGGCDVAMSTYWGLYALQHRGQESAGMSLSDGVHMDVFRGMGLLREVFQNGMPTMPAHIAIGHVRYSTTGSSMLRNTQPLLVKYAGGQISLAHNGNLTNAREIRKNLESKGYVFQTSIDSEVIVNLIARSSCDTIEEKIIDSLRDVEGAYCLTIMTENKLIGVRDPHGFRPLCVGKTSTGEWVVASESCALDAVEAAHVRDVEPGEMVIIDENGPVYRKFGEACRRSVCVFEYIYFARADSVIDGQSVYEARFSMGRTLARESRFKADLVISVPDSGTAAALGYSYESGIPYAEGLLKNRYIGRTFIQPEQKNRSSSVRIKLNAIASIVKGKSVIMVDDSIVRGTTSGKIVRLLKEAGAKEVHMCVSSPPICYPCFYGIDTSVRKELIAASKTVDEIRQVIGADSLHYLSIEGLRNSIPQLSGETLCNACFDSDYPAPVPCEEAEDGNKFVFEVR